MAYVSDYGLDQCNKSPKKFSRSVEFSSTREMSVLLVESKGKRKLKTKRRFAKKFVTTIVKLPYYIILSPILFVLKSANCTTNNDQ
ncbi:hypothetical protein MHBO_001917 [Bonamia ostreae]|uniref:Transmembrane protein n=1 Tax=Bonamia ostreae TaxID=126728 RepID=A0ABV2AKM6_9EUKA